MKDLIQHLENLLPEHDCVVVPGLGGFVQNEVAARIQPGARLFYPASKEIGFNPRLKFNDGLLAQSYQETEGLSFEAANAAIQKDVQEIQEKLEAGKFIRLGRTGTLFMIEQQLIFRPDHHNHFYPEAYGLTPFTFPLLHKPQQTEEKVSAPKSHEVHQKTAARTPEKESVELKPKGNRDEFIHIRFSKSRMRQMMAAAAVFLFLILFAKPAGLPSGNQEAGMLHNYLSAPSSVLPKKIDTIVKVESDTTSPEKVLRSSVPAPGIQKAVTASVNDVVEARSGEYFIIVSAFVKRTTAKRWMDEHQGEDILKEAGIVVGDGHARVYVKRFNNEVEANNYLDTFATKHSEYASAWVYSAKND